MNCAKKTYEVRTQILWRTYLCWSINHIELELSDWWRRNFLFKSLSASERSLWAQILDHDLKHPKDHLKFLKKHLDPSFRLLPLSSSKHLTLLGSFRCISPPWFSAVWEKRARNNSLLQSISASSTDLKKDSNSTQFIQGFWGQKKPSQLVGQAEEFKFESKFEPLPVIWQSLRFTLEGCFRRQ